jgi:hypothetical protein
VSPETRRASALNSRRILVHDWREFLYSAP